MNKTNIMWAIVGDIGLYSGTSFTRKDAIRKHTRDLGKDWEYCKANGDKAIKVTVTYEVKK